MTKLIRVLEQPKSPPSFIPGDALTFPQLLESLSSVSIIASTLISLCGTKAFSDALKPCLSDATVLHPSPANALINSHLPIWSSYEVQRQFSFFSFYHYPITHLTHPLEHLTLHLLSLLKFRFSIWLCFPCPHLFLIL